MKKSNDMIEKMINKLLAAKDGKSSKKINLKENDIMSLI